MDKIIKLTKILQTYESLLMYIQNFPEATFREAFGKQGIESFIEEEKWIRKELEKKGR